MSVTVIAEAGVNHDGKLSKALELVDIAKDSGSDYVKFQIFNAETCKGPYREILKPLQLTYDDFRKIKAHCDLKEIKFMASVFDEDAVYFVESLGCEVVKIGSGEITNLKLIKRVACTDMELILSTGMSTLKEVQDAVNMFLINDGADITLLHCVSNYPTLPEHCNLRAIETLRETFQTPMGFSDHTLGSDAMVASVAMGAEVIEKHFTYDILAVGPDHHMSLSPVKFREYVARVRITESMLGTGEKILQPGEEEMKKIARGRW